MNQITLHKQWVVKAPVEDVGIITDFERFPEHFPKVPNLKYWEKAVIGRLKKLLEK